LFNQAMRQQVVTQLSDKLDAYGDYLGTSLQAETWFKALSSADKTTWATFVTALEKHWPPVIIAEKTKAEYKRDLLDHVPSSADIGKKTTLYDRECWTHIAWAAKVLQLATSAGIDKLPSIVKDLLKDEEYKAWADFTKAVTELKGSRLTEKQEQHLSQTQELKALCADLAKVQLRAPQQNPIATLQSHFNKLSLSPTAPLNNSSCSRVPAVPTSQNLQTTYSHQLAMPQQQFIVTEDMRTTVQQLINAIPQQPDSLSGKTAYAHQIAQWNAKWGENTRVTHETGYPLRPGTAAISSGECFGCGTHGHNGRNCPLPADHAERLSRKEAAWRAITSKVLGAFNRMVATPISLVVNHAPQYHTAWIEELTEQDEGKAEGSA
jgi:hypothetical protein